MPPFKRLYLQLSLLVSLALLAPLGAVAQESGVVGIVTDSSGAALVGATVTAKNVNTGETRQVTSSDVGGYTIPGVQAGVYQVSAQKDGFQRKVVDQVVLEVQAMRTLNLMLEPGTVS